MEPEILALIEAGDRRQLEQYLQGHPLDGNDIYRYAVVAAIRNNGSIQAFYGLINHRELEREFLRHPNVVRQIADGGDPELIENLFVEAARQNNLPIINLLLPYHQFISRAITIAAGNGNLEILELLLPHENPDSIQLAQAADAAYENDQADAFDMILEAMSQKTINYYFIFRCEFDDVNRLRILYPLIDNIDRTLERGMEAAIEFQVLEVIDYLSDKKDWDWTELCMFAVNNAGTDIILELTERVDVDSDRLMNFVRMERVRVLQDLNRQRNRRDRYTIESLQYQIRTYNELLERLGRHFQ